MSQDIKFASDDELMEELKSRYNSIVIGVWRPHAKEDGLAVFKLRWYGDSFTAGGLCSAIQDEINVYRRETDEKNSQDD